MTPEIFPVTPERWHDLETLFAKKNACWCMYWRVPYSEYSKGAEHNRPAMKSLIDSGTVPGLLAYIDGVPAGWVSVAPRTDYSALERRPSLKRLDDQPVWSIVCFYIAAPFRGQGLMLALIQAAVDYARAHGASIIEAYPMDPQGEAEAGGLFTGLAKVFAKAGFVEAARPTPHRRIMRLTV